MHAHALAHDALHTGKTDAELVLDQLAHRADAAIAEMVDVVGVVALFTIVERNDIAHRLDDVFLRKRRIIVFGIEAELLVDLVAADLRKAIALRVEEQAIEQRARRVDRGRLARTETTIEFDERLLFSSSRVAIERTDDHLGIAEQLDDLFTRLRDAERTKQQRCWLLALAVDTNGKHIALVRLELEPRATRGDDLSVINSLVGGFIALGGEIHTGATNQLRNDNALGTVDDEGAARGHEREITHEHVLFLDLARFAIDETNLGEEWSLIGNVTSLALVYAILRLSKFMATEFNAHILVVGFDR